MSGGGRRRGGRRGGGSTSLRDRTQILFHFSQKQFSFWRNREKEVVTFNEAENFPLIAPKIVGNSEKRNFFFLFYFYFFLFTVFIFAKKKLKIFFFFHFFFLKTQQ